MPGSVGLTSQHVRMDQLDHTFYRELRDASPVMRAADGEGGSARTALACDLWATYYKPAPQLEPIDRVEDGYHCNRPLVERAMADPSTAATRGITQLDEMAAALAAVAALGAIGKEIRERPELQQLRAMWEGGVPDPEALAAPETARAVRRAVRAAAQAAAKEADEYLTCLSGWGLEPADLKRVAPDERWTVLARLRNPQLRAVADRIGRIRTLARRQRRQRPKHGRDELHAIEQGADLARILPSELGALSHPLRKLDFYRRLLEQQTLQYQLVERPREGRGPMVVCVDCSGSMGEHGRMTWAAGVALALVDEAQRTRRAAYVLPFNGALLPSIRFDPRRRDPEALLRVAQLGPSGGTNYTPPLDRALDLIRAGGSLQGADVVLITDGICHVPDDWITHWTEDRQALGCRSFGIYIAEAAGGLAPYVLGRVCDKTWRVSTAPGDDEAADIFAEVG